jgi:hypothetical protein
MQASRFAGIAVIAISALGIGTAGLVHAADKAKERAPSIKVLLDNDKVRVTENTFKPGDVSRNQRPARTTYYLKGGTMERTSLDGKKTRNERKAGTAAWLEADSDVVTNVGKTTVTLISVQRK